MWITLFIIGIICFIIFKIKQKLFNFKKSFKIKVTNERPNLTIYDREDTINVICVCDDTSDAYSILPKIFNSTEYSELIYVTLLIPENIDASLNIIIPKHHSRVKTIVGKNEKTIAQLNKLIQHNTKYTMILPYTVNEFKFKNWDRRLIHHFSLQESNHPNLLLTQFDEINKDLNLETQEFGIRESNLFLKSINPNFCFGRTENIDLITKPNKLINSIYDISLQYKNHFVKMNLLFENFITFY